MTKDVGAAGSATALQSLMWPEFGICTERDLYLRAQGPVAVSPEQRELRFAAGGHVSFGSWFNLFNLEKWQRECGLQSLQLQLEGEGAFEVSVVLAPRGRSWDRVVSRYAEFPADGRLEISLDQILQPGVMPGVLFFELRALGAGRLTGASWQTLDAPRRAPQLALAVTTFKREAAVARTVERFCAFRESSWMKPHVQMIVTDNGQSVELAPQEGVTLVPNENLGGAGGFTRGLLEARARGATHCLFMDDDASIHMESLERTWMMLAYARDPRTAVAGAMISEQHRWAIWENGARFFTRCQPLHMGTDLRDVTRMLAMEHEAAQPVPEDFYGGWWYFAFPVAQAEHLAFPFFVRGDDVSFSLANDFNILTLNGVVSFQESFTEKESPQTWYLDLRSHMAHHLSLPQLEVGARGVLKIAAWFFLRNLPRMHYDTLAAINLAVEDVMKGPEFFDEHADMAGRRADIKALTSTEAWQDLHPRQALPPVREQPPAAWKRHLMKLSLNGLLIPGYARLGRKITLEAQHRSHIGYAWGAAEITCLNAERTKFYTVRHSKAAAWRELKRFAKNARAFLKDYDRLSAAYRSRYGQLTSEAYWQDKLGFAASQERQAAE
ncbi:glycosyltransferase [Leisingera aquaemixtae]|uniref:Galactofuranosyl transferase GlfT2 n=1 Tax=Leisingera aquaemixtae TaxID=1396826 RepID=A0A0P1HDC7_9RHOB|nr:glycosyltransferase [Leisingera aquaemixtae]CUI01649.1 Galactofuranosyl transferase GlfT2 [Leisingera aquaemixtae]